MLPPPGSDSFDDETQSKPVLVPSAPIALASIAHDSVAANAMTKALSRPSSPAVPERKPLPKATLPKPSLPRPTPVPPAKVLADEPSTNDFDNDPQTVARPVAGDPSRPSQADGAETLGNDELAVLARNAITSVEAEHATVPRRKRVPLDKLVGPSGALPAVGSPPKTEKRSTSSLPPPVSPPLSSPPPPQRKSLHDREDRGSAPPNRPATPIPPAPTTAPILSPDDNMTRIGPAPIPLPRMASVQGAPLPGPGPMGQMPMGPMGPMGAMGAMGPIPGMHSMPPGIAPQQLLNIPMPEAPPKAALPVPPRVVLLAVGTLLIAALVFLVLRPKPQPIALDTAPTPVLVNAAPLPAPPVGAQPVSVAALNAAPVAAAPPQNPASVAAAPVAKKRAKHAAKASSSIPVRRED